MILCPATLCHLCLPLVVVQAPTPRRSHPTASSCHILARPHGTDAPSHMLGLLLMITSLFFSCFLQKKPCVSVDTRVREEQPHPHCIAALGASRIHLADTNQRGPAPAPLFIFKAKPRVAAILEWGIITTSTCRPTECKGPDSLGDWCKTAQIN